MAATTAPQTVAGHPIAMKVGGRRMSMSKSPSAQKSFLASSPPKQAEVPKSPAATTEGDSIKSPTTTGDDYPRPTDGAEHAHKEKEEEHKKDEHANKKKEKQAFEHVKQQNFNKNPPAHNNFNIKQPAGKTL